MSPTLSLKNYLQKFFTKEKLPYILIAVLLVLSAVGSFSGSPQSIQNTTYSPSVTPPSNITSTTPGIITQTKIDSTSPANNSAPNILNTTNPFSVTFNKSLTNAQILDISIQSTPELKFKIIVHTNKKTVFFQPNSPWQKNKYIISLKSPLFDQYTFSFTPTDKIDTSDIISGSESSR
jgi:hypothetical protein